MNWHTIEANTALTELNTSSESGLSSAQVKERSSLHGMNELIERGGRRLIQIIWKQATAPMTLLLILAALTAGILDDVKSLTSITFITVLTAFFGIIQEYQAEVGIDALKKISLPNVNVLRDGIFKEVTADQLVPGDVIQLDTGNIIPADVRLLEAVNLRIQEAALTAESDTIEKHTAALSGEDLPLGDRRNMAFMGTLVTQGRGLALVVATGMKTELGKIAELIQQIKPERTPLQRRLDSLGKTITLIGMVLAALIFILGFLLGDDLRQTALMAVSIFIAIVPAALPIVIAVSLSFGVQRMFAREALIRKLPAADTLGSVTVICSDKTGTLTENRMTVLMLDVAEHALDLTEEMRRGGSLRATRGLGAPIQSSLSLAAIGGALCNDAKLVDVGDDRYHTLGDPTEGALVVAAAKMGYWKSSLDISFPRATELPFDSERKRMTTVHHMGQYDPEVLAGLKVGDHRYIAFTKGNVDNLLDISTHLWVNGRSRKMDSAWRSKIEAANERLVKKGMRVLGVGFRLLDAIPEIIQTDLEQKITLVGLFGMIDPPRKEVQEAIAMCRTAGIRPVMITGDHPLTAIEIARQLGITENGRALRGVEIENLSFDELKNVVDEVSVFARVAPEHKLKIVQALQEKGHIVAMTGDNLNDAPALRKADIGIAMGVSGTDVSKEASDMVLLNDNFATIVAGVREGRAISNNIRKFMQFSMAGNIGKVVVLFAAPFLGNYPPLLPLQLLWLNLIIDGLLGLGISSEKAKADTMKHKPDITDDLSSNRRRRTIGIGLLIGALSLGPGLWRYFTNQDQWQTMVFTSLAFMQVFHALALRSEKDSFFKTGLPKNPLLTGMIFLVIILQMMILYIPGMAHFFELIPLRWQDLLITVIPGLLVFGVLKIQKSNQT